MKLLFLFCAAICLAWNDPKPSIAQDAPFRLDPVPLGTDRSASHVEPTTVPSGAFSLAAPANQPDKHGSLEQPIYACACGCGVFEVGTSSMLPHGQGGMVWTEWDYQNQNDNRHGTSGAPSANNDDKDIRTNYFTLGFQYFFDRKWGVQVEIPVDHRHFATSDATYNWTALGDIRIRGLYTGFVEDQSMGISLGVKVPSGKYTKSGPDRDTQIGSGSTDVLFGGFFRRNLSNDGNWTFFAQFDTDLPVIIQDHYRPGFEADSAAGIYYSGFSFHGVRISPVGQVILSYRSSDGGDNSAHPVASGYERVLLSPGIEFDYHPFSVYADVEIPVFEYVRGDQLAAPAMFKVIASYSF